MPATDMIGRAMTGSATIFGAGPLATICYQSRSPKPPTADDLEELLADARERNKRFGVTGMLVHEGDRFYQWLEGPSAALDVLWTSIRQDGRHEDVELLGEGVTPARLFSEWDLRFLARSGGGPEIAKREESEAPHDVAEAEAESDSVVLARLALAGDDGAMADLVRGRAAAGEGAHALCRALLEPAAHQLGDWWCEDVCGSFDITLALGRLQSLVRHVDARRCEVRRVAIEGRRVLISPPPRETHMLGASLLGGFFHRAGWSVQAEFPQNDQELMGLVSTHWFDALALTLSDVFTRRDRLAALIQTISDVRTASRNPGMAVIVGGRAFRGTQHQDAERVGADVHYASASHAVEDLDYWLFMHRFSPPPADQRQADGDGPAFTPLDLVRILTPALALRVDEASKDRPRS